MADIIETKENRVIIARMKPGEDLLQTAIKTVEEKNIMSGSLQMIGAVSGVNLGYFDVKEKKYKNFQVNEDLEVVSCMGNVSRLQNGEIVVHAHMIVADSTGRCYGGHLLEGCQVSVTIELFIHETVDTLTRKEDHEFGLNLLALKD